MIGLTSLKVYNSSFNKTEHSNKLHFYTDNFDKVLFEEIYKFKILNFSDFTPSHLQHAKIGPRFIQANSKIRLEKSSTDGYITLSMGYARSPFRDFEIYLTIVIGLDEDDIQLILKQYNSHFITHESSPRIYTVEVILEAVYTMGGQERTLQNDYDDTSLKTKLILTHFGGTFGVLRFEERYSFNVVLGFTQYWDYNPTNSIHADNPS